MRGAVTVCLAQGMCVNGNGVTDVLLYKTPQPDWFSVEFSVFLTLFFVVISSLFLIQCVVIGYGCLLSEI